MMPGKPEMFKVGDHVEWREPYQPETFMGFAGPGPFKVTHVEAAEGTCRHDGVVRARHTRPGAKCNNPYPPAHPQRVTIGDMRTGAERGTPNGSHLRKL